MGKDIGYYKDILKEIVDDYRNKREIDKCSDGQKQVNQDYGGLVGWTCPRCGRGLSPYTSTCPCIPSPTITWSGNRCW